MGQSDKTFRVLFVCTGNTCRSPMAEGILKSMLTAEVLEWTSVNSAGTLGLRGVPASEGAIATAAEDGVDISDHLSTPLDATLVDGADLVLAMEPFHKEWVLRLSPGAGGKTYLLGEFCREEATPESAAVDDPIGGSADAYRECYGTIREHIAACLPAIERLVRCKMERAGRSR